ncbi:MAG TPA: ribosome recycling factor [Clostridia bacterium]|nr:ribosome recycling factor [Clostridia bacterium]
MSEQLFQEAEGKMKKALEALNKEFASVRAGRANPALLDRVQVDYYGVMTPINQLSSISAPEARLLMIQPWDKSVIPNVEKAILKSDLGLNPSNDGTVIRISIPQLTQERRQELVKVVRKKAEEFRVVIRNIRRETNDKIKAQEKNGEVSEDESKKMQDRTQKLTDKYVELVDKALEIKEEEIQEV